MNTSSLPEQAKTTSHVSPPIWIDKPQDLERAAGTLATAAFVAIDTESNSLFAYQEQACLIQISIPEEDYLVDPLVLKAQHIQTAFASIFADPNIEKVFHAAEYDLIVLSRDFGFTFANLFDTMWAARMLGWDAVGLGSILEKEFGIHVDKRHQRANWGQRPLPEHLIDYARLDTHYLLPLRNRLRTELEKSGRWELAQEDFNNFCRLSNIDVEHRKNNVIECWRLSGAENLSPQKLAVLQELCIYRDQQARIQNRPLFKVLHDQVLLEIAEASPNSISQMDQLPGLNQRQIQHYGKALLGAIRRGLKSAPLYPPARGSRPGQAYLNRLDTLRDWRKQAAGKIGVESDLILSRVVMEETARQNPRSLEALNDIFKNYPIRFERFGRDILDVVEKNQ